MYKIRQYIKRLSMPAMLMTLACIAVSCITESGDCPPEEAPRPKEVFQLTFRICSRLADSDSRADVIEEGSVAENMLDVDNIIYYIFDRDRKFLLQLKPEATVTTRISENYAIYEVTAKIGNGEDPSDYFKRHWNTQVDFYILALANYSGYASSMPKPAENTTLDDFMNGKTTLLNALPDTEKILNGTNHIPMAGLQLFSINGSWFETQTGEAPIDLTFLTGKQLNMLRSVAKLEVIDKINYKDPTDDKPEKKDQSIRIAGVAIDGVMKDALLLPTANQWIFNNYGETRQVQNASVTDNYAQPGTEGSSLNFVYDERETKRRADKCPVYSCYVWEYLKGDIPANQAPYLSVTVSDTLNQDNPEQTYRLPLLTDMTPGALNPAPLSSILRNTLYRYEISAVEAGLSIMWEVCPMDKASADITFN